MLLTLAFLLFTPPSLAGSQSERDAEAIRLVAEVERLGQKLAWSGVERNYASLVELKGVTVPSPTHLVGAQAALERGDIGGAWERAQRAVKSARAPQELERASAWTADFYVNYGEVHIQAFTTFSGPLQLRLRDATFSPSAKAALAYAQERLNTTRSFEGFLPMGRYEIAGHTFEIVGGPKERVWLRTPKASSSEPAVSSPDPTATDDRPDRIVTLTARGGGWPADQWDALAASVRDRLYQVDGVLAVDIFGPDDPWILVDLTPDLLTSTALDVPGVAATLRQALSAPDLVVSGHTLAVPPSPHAPAAVAAIVVGPATLVAGRQAGRARRRGYGANGPSRPGPGAGRRVRGGALAHRGPGRWRSARRRRRHDGGRGRTRRGRRPGAHPGGAGSAVSSLRSSVTRSACVWADASPS
jgi:hypothetical protein